MEDLYWDVTMVLLCIILGFVTVILLCPSKWEMQDVYALHQDGAVREAIKAMVERSKR